MEKINQPEVVEMLNTATNAGDIDDALLKDNACSSTCQQSINANFNSIVDESKSSTPNSGMDYKSCSNSSTPDRRRGSLDRARSFSSQAEAVSSIKMSANIASKLSQMRVSRDEMENVSQHSFEELTVDELGDASLSEGGSNMGSPVVGAKKQVQKSSPRVVFPYVSCLPFENNIVFCFVLSVWDNIVGPQTVYVWKRKSFPSQKTFDDLIEEGEGVEIGEDSIELAMPSKEEEAEVNTSKIFPSKEDVGLSKQKKNQQSPSNRSVNNSSTNLERPTSLRRDIRSPIKQANTLSESMKDSSPSCSVKQTSEENVHNSGDLESFCKNIGEDILMQSLKAVEDKETSAAQEITDKKCRNLEDESVVEGDNNSKPVPVLVLPAQSSFDSPSDPDEQGE